VLQSMHHMGYMGPLPNIAVPFLWAVNKLYPVRWILTILAVALYFLVPIVLPSRPSWIFKAQ
jgi:hypothetical protein